MNEPATNSTVNNSIPGSKTKMIMCDGEIARMDGEKRLERWDSLTADWERKFDKAS